MDHVLTEIVLTSLDTFAWPTLFVTQLRMDRRNSISPVKCSNLLKASDQKLQEVAERAIPLSEENEGLGTKEEE